VNALSNDKVGEYLGTNFIATYQKVGSFRVVDGQKQGGNVASYFCTADGRVLHAVPGPVNAETLLREARWAVETHKLGLLESRGDDARLKAFFRKAHAERLRHDHGYNISNTARPSERPFLNQRGSAHRILALYPLARIEEVYKYVFEKVLGEQVSTAPVEETISPKK